MSVLADMIVGKSEQTKGEGTQSGTTTRGPSTRLRQPEDILIRQIIGQAVNPPETAISVPTQQAISNLQANMGQYGATSLAQRLGPQAAGGAGSPMAGANGSYLPGPNQQGLQTRAQLGLPGRKDYFTFVPSAEDIQRIGLADIRGGTAAPKHPSRRIDRLEDRIERRQAAGKKTGMAEAKLERFQQRQERKSGDAYARSG